MPRRTVDPAWVPATILTPLTATKAAPLSTNPDLGLGILQMIELQIPAGHSGATGLRITLAGQQIFPWSNTPAWLVGDDLLERYDIDLQVDSGLRVLTYNIGQFPHTFYLRFLVKQIDTTPVRRTVTLVPHDAISRPGA